ncbi:hypothetical protein BgAZ_301730 [Babesia gibsoni]|uniref:Uncharacterized protein n=1 Tax=Babesia gibsoni TaxID=33632 RepID=A0AAD8LHA5_BABGI|nr:hypothetical protein BgAZ_301730 [Babesia gibsoni]
MGYDNAPEFVVMRKSAPSYQCVAWPILDVSDALDALEKEAVEVVKPTVYNPTLLLPQYVSDVFLGETLHLAMVLSNSQKVTFSEVCFKVEIAIEGVGGDPITIEPFTNITLEPKKKPETASISHTFKHEVQHCMTFTINFKSGRKAYKVVKKAVWNVMNPFKFQFIHEKDATGKTQLEVMYTNVSKLVMSIMDAKLGKNKDDTFQDCLCLKNEDINAVAVISPAATHSVMFKDVDPTKPMSLHTSWFCYERGAGELVTPVECFKMSPVIAYTVLKHPGAVKSRKEFTVIFKVMNNYTQSLRFKVVFKREKMGSIVVQIDDYLDLGTLAPEEERVVKLPLMCLRSGIHGLNGVEIHADPSIVVPVTDIEIFAV